jgi:hypothetical protein
MKRLMSAPARLGCTMLILILCGGMWPVGEARAQG